jgi:hypothetical protein
MTVDFGTGVAEGLWEGLCVPIITATTSQMEESEAKQWLKEALGLFSDVAQAYGKEQARPTSFPTYPKNT